MHRCAEDAIVVPHSLGGLESSSAKGLRGGA